MGWIYRSDSFARRPILGSADMTMMYFTYRVKFALLGKKMTSRIWQTRLALVVSVVCGTAGIARGESHNNGLMQSNAEYGERDDGSGAFRTHCLETHSSFDDPLVAPGRPDGAHHHVFFGNPTLDELRPCYRTLGYFTPVRERGRKWDNIDAIIQTIIRQLQLSGY
ncbi:MAG: hypothetical protein ACI9ND_002748, partial [Yoonia sp.]